MTDAPAANPYEPGRAPSEPSDGRKRRRRWPTIFVAIACSYYLLSALTLPLVPHVWIGEAPMLAVAQLPKAVLKSVAQQAIIGAMSDFGWRYKSHSPAYAATHPWALGVAVVAPALALIVGVVAQRGMRRGGWSIAALIGCATCDGVVTFLFDATSKLKLYDGVYF